MPNISPMNRNVAMLLGLLYTDGCVSPKGVRSWRVYFSNKSHILVYLFRDCMKEVFGLPNARVRIDITRDGLLRAIVDSKEVGDVLTARYGTFRTLAWKDGSLPLAELPVAELKQSKNVGPFLQAAFSCDGGVHLYPAYRNGLRRQTIWLIRTVYLACAHPALRKQYMELLASIGIHAREVAQDGKIKIETERDIKLFHRTVGFVPGAIVTHSSKFWDGYEKQALLDLLVRSYGNPSSIYAMTRFEKNVEIMI